MKTKNRKCIYAGSFDPLTNGHYWMIQEGARLFDELVVAISVNPQKKSNYPLDTRLKMMSDALHGIDNVTVTSFTGQFLVDFATTHGADFVLRGVRGETDFEYERGMRHINDQINPHLCTVFLMPPKNLSETSSSIVRSLMGPPGWTHIVKQFVPKTVFQTALQFELKRQFFLIFPNANSKDLEELFSDVSAKYQEGHRAYHNLTHIAECLSELQTIEVSKDDRTNIEFAIWFHDVIYDPKSKSNEEDSADYFLSNSSVLGLSNDRVSKIAEYIRATKQHQPTLQNDQALRYFLDIDLSILGAEEARFFEYDSAIRAEYSWVPGLIYSPKRKKVLRAFVERAPIFQTLEFQSRYESRARVNLQKIIDG